MTPDQTSDDDEDDLPPVSPGPWRLNPGWNQLPKYESPILDANGKPVFEISEWLDVRPSNLALIIHAVNSLPAWQYCVKAPGKRQRRPSDSQEGIEG